jgi:hypothetical protein
MTTPKRKRPTDDERDRKRVAAAGPWGVSMLHAISLGAGVQSTAMLLLAAEGEIMPMPDCAIFADTQSEPPSVYEHLNWLCSLKLPFPIYTVTAGSLEAAIGRTRPSGRWPQMPLPAFIAGRDGKAALANRSCTQDYKIIPIRRKLRSLLGITRKRSPLSPVATQWIGISLDEAHRMKPSREAWAKNRWPLIERLMTRDDCLKWLSARGYPKPPKSACTFCPFHNGQLWADMKTNDPHSFAAAVEIDLRIRNLWAGRSLNGLYLHRSLIPLADVKFQGAPEVDGFGNECEGVCGV